MDQRKKIMVVDDDDAVTEYLHIKLGARYQIVSTNTPENVLRLARSEGPAVIVCDIDMPGMSGPEVSEKLDSDADTRDIPVIYLTGLALPHELKSTHGMLGGKPAVSKRSPLSELVERIESLGGAPKQAPK